MKATRALLRTAPPGHHQVFVVAASFAVKQFSNVPVARLSLREAVIHYRGGAWLEQGFHRFKDRPLGIRPLFVRRDDQIIGLTRLLSLGMRLLTIAEMQVRRGENLMVHEDEIKGRPRRTWFESEADKRAAEPARFKGKRVCCVISGGNADPALYARLIEGI